MTEPAVIEPTAIDASKLVEFVREAELAVVLVSVHSAHAFNPALGRQLASEHQTIALGTVDLTELLASGGRALPFLHEGFRRCGAPAAFGVLPGYCLFREGTMLAWDAGLPSFADASAIARGALLGAVWAGINRDLAFVSQALQQAAEQVAAQRITLLFRQAIANDEARREAARDTASGAGAGAGGGPSSAVNELEWAYALLGVPPTATDREVHQAWRRRRIEMHPDLAGGDAAEFARRSRISAEINRAQEIILTWRHGRSRAAS